MKDCRPVIMPQHMVDQGTIDEAARILLSTAPAGSEVILFGSHARGDARDSSDVDFLVVEPMVLQRRSETVRLRGALRPLGIPVDVLVLSRRAFEAWRDQPNTVVYEAAREGKVYRHAA